MSFDSLLFSIQHAFLRKDMSKVTHPSDFRTASVKQIESEKTSKEISDVSTLGQVGFAGAAAYVSAKHGVVGLTQTSALVRLSSKLL